MADTVELMRQRVLDMAIRGELVEQREEEGTAKSLLKDIQLEKKGLTKGKKSKTDTSFPTINDKELPFEIPKSWGWVRIGDIAQINPRNQIDDDTIVGFIPMTMIEDGYSNKYAYEERKWADVKKGFTHFRQGDIILAKITPCFENKKSAILNYLPNEYGAGTTELHVIRVYDSYVLKEYIYSLFKNDAFLEEGRKTRKGTAGQQRIGKDFVSNYLIGLPPLAEQKRIVAKMQEILAAIDQIGERKKEALAIIRNMRQTALQNAIMGQLVEQDENDEPASEVLSRIQAEKIHLVKEKKIKKEKPLPEIEPEEIPFDIPEKWEWVRLGSILEKIGSGSTPKGGSSVYVDKGVPFIRSQNVYNDGLRMGNVAFITEETNKSKSGSQVFPGDILLNITGASIGRCALVPDEFEVGNVNQHVLINRPIDSRIRHYLHVALTSPYIFNEIMSLQKGGTKEGLSAANAKLLKIPLPPLEEQERIVEKLDQIMSICDQMEVILDGSREEAAREVEEIVKASQ